MSRTARELHTERTAADLARHFGPETQNLQGAELLRNRFSARAFIDRPIDAEVLEGIFSLANFSPSWCNIQPWNVHAITGDALTALATRLVESSSESPPSPEIDPPIHYEGQHLDRRRAAGYALYESVGISRDDHAARLAQAGENFTFFNAPCALIISVPRYLGPYALVDIGAYLSYVQLAAQSVGIASIAQAALALYPDAVRSIAPVSEDDSIVCGISMGYPDLSHPINEFRTQRDAQWTITTALRS